MDSESEVKPLVDVELFAKHELAVTDPVSSSTAKSADSPAEPVKLGDVNSSSKGDDSPHLPPKDSFGHLNNLNTPVKTEGCKEEDIIWDAMLHTSIDIKDEQLSQSFELDDDYERRDNGGIDSSQEYETNSSNPFIDPPNGIKSEVPEVNDRLTPTHLTSKTKPFIAGQGLPSKKTEISIKPFGCSHCSASFPNKCQLSRHMRTHTGEKPYRCSHCSASFAQKNDLTRHMRTRTGEKPYRCSHCSASFANKSSLTKHMRTHTGEKPYRCSHCSASFADKSYLTKHMRIHTGEKPYRCSHCSASFGRKCSLTKHMRTHAGEKPFGCSI